MAWLTDVPTASMLGRMRIRVLGPTSVEGAELAPRDRQVLSVLVLHAGRFCAAERIADALYEETPPATWRKVVQGAVVHLRRALGARAVESSNDGYRLALGDDEIDARRFDRLVEQAGALVTGGEDERAAIALSEALALFRGEPYGDLERWEPARAEAVRLVEARLAAEELWVETLLAAGRDREATSAAAALAEQQPLREQRWAALALAQYRTGRQGDALRSIRRARVVLADELGLDPGHELVALERSILAQDPSLDDTTANAPLRATCPYKGLASYDVGDAGDFFGRDTAVRDVLARLTRWGLVVIVGPSGSGKSSLARAGVAPALERAGRPASTITPGARPVDALAATPPGTAVVIDQLEEIFTACDDPAERARFAALLIRRASASLVVATLRADHVASVAEVAPLAELIESRMYLLGPMDDADLRSAIEGPAARAGLRLEPGLAEIVLRDVVDEPGALPLLSHALAETWLRREGRTLTIAGYRAGGGVQGAVAQTADEVVDGMPPEGRRIARELFLRLVVVGEHGPATRRRERTDELRADDATAAVLDALVKARLVTIDAESVEVAHESLARAWPRLQSWLDEDRDGQRVRMHLAVAASEWEAMQRDDAELYQGARLRAVEEWLTTGPAIAASERAFVDASVARRRRTEEDAAVRAATQARSNRRLRRVVAATAAALVLALVASTVAVGQTHRARTVARGAAIRSLIDRSAADLGTKRDLAALLAATAYRLAPGVNTLGALLRTFSDSPGYDGSVAVPIHTAVGGKLLPDGRRFVVVDGTAGVHVVDLATRKVLESLPALLTSDDGDAVVDVSHDGRYVALGSDGPGDPDRLTVWDLGSRRRRFADVSLGFVPGAVSFSPDGRLIAVSGGAAATVEVRSATDGRLVRRLPSLARPAGAHLHNYTAAVRFLSDTALAVGSQSGVVRILDPRSGAERARLVGPDETSEIDITTTSDGRTLVGTGFAGTEAWDLATRHREWLRSAPGDCNEIVTSAVIGAVLCAEPDSRVEAFDLVTGSVVPARFDYQQGAASGIAVSPDGNLLVETGGAVVELWRLDGSGPVTRRIASGSDLHPEGYDARGRLIVGHVAANTGLPIAPFIVDPATGAVVDRLKGIVAAATTPNQNRLIALFADGTGGFYDLGRRRRVPGIVIHLPFTPTVAAASDTKLYIANGGDLQGVDLNTGALVAPVVHQFTQILGISVDPAGQHLFTSEPNGIVPRAPDGKRIGPPIPSIDAAVGATEIVVSQGDGHLEVFDAATRKPQGRGLPSISGLTNGIQLSGDESRALVVGRDRTIRIADMATRQFIGDPISLGDGGDPIAIMSNDGQHIVYADDRGIVTWDLSPDRLVAGACAAASRDITRAEWTSNVIGLGPYRSVCP